MGTGLAGPLLFPGTHRPRALSPKKPHLESTTQSMQLLYQHAAWGPECTTTAESRCWKKNTTPRPTNATTTPPREAKVSRRRPHLSTSTMPTTVKAKLTKATRATNLHRWTHNRRNACDGKESVGGWVAGRRRAATEGGNMTVSGARGVAALTA